ncbi:MAG: PAS domain-containing protein [Candidatus Methylomirabilales bacterium]
MRVKVSRPKTKSPTRTRDASHQHGPRGVAEAEKRPPAVLKELQKRLRELQDVEKELRRQNEELAVARKAAEAACQHYKDLFDFAPDGYLVTDAGGTIQEANRAAAALFASQQDHLVGTPLAAFVFEEDRNTFHTELGRLSKVRRVRDWDVRLRPRGGAPFPAAITVAAIRSPQGSVVGLRWFLRDISERKQAEESLRSAKAAVENLIECSPDIIISVDLNRNITELNRAAEEVFGYDKTELLGKPVDILYADPSGGLRMHTDTLKGGQFKGEIVNRRKNGETFRSYLSAAVMRDPRGRVVGVMGVSRTVTERPDLARRNLRQKP